MHKLTKCFIHKRKSVKKLWYVFHYVLRGYGCFLKCMKIVVPCNKWSYITTFWDTLLQSTVRSQVFPASSCWRIRKDKKDKKSLFVNLIKKWSPVRSFINIYIMRKMKSILRNTLSGSNLELLKIGLPDTLRFF